jgi:predicted RNA binding protein with dsRBD fold (UPF0201 family)
MEQVTVHVEVEVNPTENEANVKAAVSNMFGNLKFTCQPAGKQDLIIADAKSQDSLVKLRNILRSDRIRDASRKALFRSIRGETIQFCLNKQVASAGHISFCEETAESPLGPIRVTITAEDPRQLVEWLAEKTDR